jgi:hypothetical protein
MKRTILILACLLVGAVLPCPAQAPAKPEELMRKLMTAVENNDYASFVADSIPEFKGNVTPQIVEGVSKQLASRMKEGYECVYLTEMKQREFKIYLWKVVFKDGGDEALIKMVVRDDQIAGFWIQ